MNSSTQISKLPPILTGEELEHALPLFTKVERGIHAARASALSPGMTAARRTKLLNRYGFDQLGSMPQREAAELFGVGREFISDCTTILMDGSDREIALAFSGNLDSVSRIASQIRVGMPSESRAAYNPEKVRNNTRKENSKLYHQLKEALVALSELPHVEDMVEISRHMSRRIEAIEDRLPAAVEWLTEFSHEWNRKQN